MRRWLSFLLAAVMLISCALTMGSFAAQSEAQTFISLLNQRRAAQGLVTLGTDGGLMDAAAIRAKEQAVRTSHYRPDGSYFNSVNSKAEAECYWWFQPAETGIAQAALDAFMNSSDHRALLMHRQVRSVGAAYYDTNGTRYWVILLSTSAASAGSTAPSYGTVGGFSDVHTSDYFAESVLWASQNRIATGTSSTTFSPYQPCTRAQVVTFLWRAAGSPSGYGSGSNTFRDVARGSYYDSAVAWAVSRRITNGTDSRHFSPDAVCTRAEAVTFLWRYSGSPFAFTTSRFRDVSSGSYYAQAVAWAVNNDITEGTGTNTFSPDAPCTRAEFVTLLYRLKH
ncbi:MAG: S-layer homology domain-containing protein [Oscillospiraceae bacterium]|nr:S-layer homology domain-containing protein [Oscillospiraceae bacterium]